MKAQVEGIGLKDQDLMIDMRIGNTNEITNLYKANAQKNIEIVAEEMKMKKLIA